ncbi:unnamed protein product, partial [Closterium sp. NIES-53]
MCSCECLTFSSALVSGLLCSPTLPSCLSNFLLPSAPPLSLSVPPQICIQVGDAVSGAADYNLCTSYLPVDEWTTCADAVDWYGLSWLDLYRLNPGLNCDTLSSLTASEVLMRVG